MTNEIDDRCATIAVSTSEHIDERSQHQTYERKDAGLKGTMRLLDSALTVGSEEAWWVFCAFAYRNLTLTDRRMLAFFSVCALDKSDAERVADAASAKLPTLIDPIDEADWWASNASRAELRAYAMASALQLTAPEKRRLISVLQERMAA